MWNQMKEVQVPLFPGYTFCRFDPHDRLRIMMAPGLVHVVGRGRIPVPIAEQELEAVRRMLNSELFTRPFPFLQTGQTVRIAEGPLAGIEGILLDIKNSHRVVVSISLLQRSVATEIDLDWVRPLARKAPIAEGHPIRSSFAA